eukprot:CAMPEP_0176456310 /NCGR_PEP_ID=MMETSP0127-20121128/31207_1 /TAXON_ID=938130 /ORGANISM="Platyophrya macrostoma, Strain WH" /LENGTH=384 /DNA_ID=CAMNT_0017846235 /DNA_START=52 /DNA_END=1206 /DNA_ORIENTATION=+
MEDNYKKIDHFYYKPTSKPLGKGAFATVYRAYDESQGGKEVAVKVIPAMKMLENQENYELFMREIEVLRQIKGDHIVHLLDVKRTPNNLYIFTEFCNGGDLDTMLKKNGAVGEEKALEFVYQFSKAFNTINNLEIKNSSGRKVIIMHRDIKSANILFHDDVLKIADFGFAKMIDEASKNVKMQHTLLGTPLYMSPQILNDEAYTPKCDIWSAGFLIYECMFGKMPWTGNSIGNLLKNIRNQPLKMLSPVQDETKDLLEKMLTINEDKRISWKEIESHPAVVAAGKRWEAKHFAKYGGGTTTTTTTTTTTLESKSDSLGQQTGGTFGLQTGGTMGLQTGGTMGIQQNTTYPQQTGYTQQNYGYPQQTYPQQTGTNIYTGGTGGFK